MLNAAVFVCPVSIFPRCQTGGTGLRTVMFEVAPCRYEIAGMAQSVEQVPVQHFIPHTTVKLFTNLSCMGFPGAM